MLSGNPALRYGNVPPAVCQQAPLSAAQEPGVMLEWIPPTNNTDGSTLNDLVAYRIDWGRSDSKRNECIWIANPEQTSYVVTDLAPGDYEFVIVAVNASGVASRPSDVIHRSVR